MQNLVNIDADSQENERYRGRGVLQGARVGFDDVAHIRAQNAGKGVRGIEETIKPYAVDFYLWQEASRRYR